MSAFPTDQWQPAGTPVQPTRIGRRVRSSKPYIIPMATGFTGNAGENQGPSSPSLDWDYWIRGMTTELSLFNRMLLEDPSKKYQFASDPVPFGTYMGQIYKEEIYRWWRQPYRMRNNQVLKTLLINDKGNANGNLVFFAEKADTLKYHVYEPDIAETQLRVEFKFTGTAGELITAKTTPQDYDILIMGATYNGSTAPAPANTVSILDESASYYWSLLPQRFEYFTGMLDQVQPILWYPFPIFLARNKKLILQANNLTTVPTNATLTLAFTGLKGFTTFQDESSAVAYQKRNGYIS
jgi:hypothetical protein